MIIAHRGYKKNHPENTIPAFEDAFLNGADAIETDLRIGPSGKIIVSHNPVKDDHGLLILEELFEYINSKNASFFLELKSSNPELLGPIIRKIHNHNLWDKVHLIGFASRIKTAILVQDKFPKLLVDQIIQLPYLDLVRMRSPKKSNAVFIGWLEGVALSERLFNALMNEDRVQRLREYYESHGFNVYAGVINHEKGIQLFRNAGIHDIFTDEVEMAKHTLSSASMNYIQ